MGITLKKQEGFELRESKPDKNGKTSHSYWLNGERIPGVTTIIDAVLDKPALKQWASDCAVDKLRGIWKEGSNFTNAEIDFHLNEARMAFRNVVKKAADFGTQAHDWVEAYIYGEERPMPESPEVQSSIKAFMDWRTANHVEWLEVEVAVTDGKVGGKLDSIALVNGEARVIDLKTGKGIYESAIYQVGKYHCMAQSVTDSSLGRPLILHLPKDGQGFNAMDYPADPIFVAGKFDLLYDIYRANQVIKKALDGAKGE